MHTNGVVVVTQNVHSNMVCVRQLFHLSFRTVWRLEINLAAGVCTLDALVGIAIAFLNSAQNVFQRLSKARPENSKMF